MMDGQDLSRARNPAQGQPEDMWERLAPVRLSNAHLARNRVITAQRRNPAHIAIDMLRTRLLQAMKENGWRRVAITSPGAGCGKTFVAANLAISLARGESRRIALVDMDLRHPGLADVLGVSDPPSIRDFLLGYSLPEEYLLRVGQNLALGLNATVEENAAEFILENVTGEVLQEMQEVFAPDVVLYDLPPALAHDDVMAFLPHVDGVLLVAGGGLTTADEIEAVEQMVTPTTPLLGVVLNKAESGSYF